MQKNNQVSSLRLINPQAVRQAKHSDRKDLASLIHFETYIHRHLDYRPPLDRIDHQPFLVLERDGEIHAALACPPDPPEVAWIRLFGASNYVQVDKAWSLLWPKAVEVLGESDGLSWMAAIPIYKWFEALLRKNGFQRLHRIILLMWEGNDIPEMPPKAGISIRPMTLDDLKAVEAIDQASFVPIWQNSEHYLEAAFRQAAVATVVEREGKLAGYQISTAGQMGGHLARLAVHPENQGQGLGKTLLNDLLKQFQRRGATRVTVNTQHDNNTSMKLYKKVGFRPTGEEYPIYYLPL